MHWTQSTISGTLLLVLLSSCGITGFGRPFHQESQSPHAEVLVVTVVEAFPPARSAPRPDPKPVLAAWDSALDPLQSETFPERLRAFTPHTEVVLDLGVGECPFDDGVPDFDLDFRPVRGFSDALIQLELRTRLEPGFCWYGVAAMNRIQEETLLETMDQADWAWFGVGVQYSF